MCIISRQPWLALQRKPRLKVKREPQNVPEGPQSNLSGDQSCGGHLPRDTGPANTTKEKLHLHCLGLAKIAYCLTENIIISNIKVLMFGTFPSDRA